MRGPPNADEGTADDEAGGGGKKTAYQRVVYLYSKSPFGKTFISIIDSIENINSIVIRLLRNLAQITVCACSVCTVIVYNKIL